VRLSSEGARSAVLQVGLPAALAGDLAPAEPSPSPSPASSSHGSGTSADAPWLPWLAGAGFVLVAAAVAAVVRRRTLR
jgi:hypothetical protein